MTMPGLKLLQMSERTITGNEIWTSERAER